MFSLIPLTQEDGEILEQIHSTCFPDSWDRKTFTHLLGEKMTCGWLARSQGGIPIGFILARILMDEAEILTFAVCPSSQNLGVGRYLLTELRVFLRSVKCPKIYLEVATDNVKAIALYNSMGFRTVGSRPNYYRRSINNFIAADIMASDEIK